MRAENRFDRKDCFSTAEHAESAEGFRDFPLGMPSSMGSAISAVKSLTNSTNDQTVR